MVNENTACKGKAAEVLLVNSRLLIHTAGADQ